MSYLKNIFVLFILISIFLVIGLQIFLSPKVVHDTNSYLTLLNGECFLNQTNIEKQKKYTLRPGDEIETKQESLAVVEWGDGSVTRLGALTKIVVKENMVVQENQKIQIAYEIISGKSWSKVVSFLGSDSYFKAYIDDLEAGVRGSTFEVNKDEGYISVYEHIVSLRNTKGFTAELSQNQAFSLFNFSLIDLNKFVTQIQDSAWRDINNTMDREYVEKLKKDILLHSTQRSEKLLAYIYPKYKILLRIQGGESLNTLAPDLQNSSQSTKAFISSQVSQEYQKVYFAKIEDGELYKQKIYLRKILLLTSPNSQESEALIRGSIYDMQDMLSTKNYEYLNDVMEDISSGKDIIKNINIDFKQYFNGEYNLPENIQSSIKEKLGSGVEIFGGSLFNLPLQSDSLQGTIGEINDVGTQTINQALDSVENLFKK